MPERPGPREVALRILAGLFGDEAPDADARPAGPVRLSPFQAEAAARARATLARRGGVILADAVGLGKTYVALGLIAERLRAGGDAVVVVPAALRRVWTSGLRHVAGSADRVRLLSHARLSRGGRVPPPGPESAPRLFVVDEAHRFRNPHSRRYATLARLVAAARAPGRPGADVLLITATPINNGPGDLRALVRLFADDGALADVGVPSLRGAFDAATGPGSGAGDPALRPVVRELVIRRDRQLVRDRFGRAAIPGHPVGFPRRAPPVVIRYPAPRLGELVAAVARLELAPYGPPGAAPRSPSAAPHQPSGGGASGARALVRLGLLKRLESSPAAARASLRRLDALFRAFVRAAEAGRVVSPRVLRGGDADGDPLQLVLTELIADPAPPDVDVRAAAASAARDLERVADLLRTLDREDGKLAALERLLDTLAPEPVVVFTEFRDTAAYLHRSLLARQAARIDGAGAWLGRQPAGRRTVVERFAPRAHDRPPPPAREAVHVLLATDVIAEGMNLQDARHVVSYDLPWNPVRLLQRIGRVDRLGSRHPEVVPYLFAPAGGLDAVLGLTRRLRAKLHGIVDALGDEGGDRLLAALAREPAALRVALEAAERDRTRDPRETLRTLWIRERTARSGAGDPGRARRRGAPGPGVPSAATLSVPPGHPAAGIAALALLARGPATYLLEVTDHGHVRELGGAGAAALEAALRTRAEPGPPPGPASGPRTERDDAGRDGTAAGSGRDDGGGSRPAPGTADRSLGGDPLGALLGAARRYLDARTLAARAPPPLPGRDPASRLSRRLRTALARAGSAAHPGLLARAETALAALAAPLPPAIEHEAVTLLAPARAMEAGELVGRIEALLEGAARLGTRTDRAAAGTPGITPIAVLWIHVQTPSGPVDDPCAPGYLFPSDIPA